MTTQTTTETTTNHDFIRPEVLENYTSKIPTPCGSLYLTLCEHKNKLCEVRVTMGKSGSCARLLLETFALLISVLLQTNLPRQKIYKILFHQFEGGCGNLIRFKGEEYNSCIDYIITKVFEDLAMRGEVKLEE